MLRVLLLLILAGLGQALVCESEAAAVAYFVAALQATPPGRFAVRDLSLADVHELVTQRFRLISSLEMASSAANTYKDDALSFVVSEEWLPSMPRVAFDAEASDANCTDAALRAASVFPPPEMREATNAFVILTQDLSACPANMVQTWNAANNASECSCADGEVCTAETNDDLLLNTVLYLLLALWAVTLIVDTGAGLVLVLRVTPVEKQENTLEMTREGPGRPLLKS